MSYSTGKSKSLDSITLSDMLEYHIWEWALDKEGVEDQDETWQPPIIDRTDVSAEIFTPTILLTVIDYDLYASAEYDHETRSLEAITIWVDENWVSPEQAGLIAPVTLVSKPSINGTSNVEFIIRDLRSDHAKRL